MKVLGELDSELHMWPQLTLLQRSGVRWAVGGGVRMLG